MSRPSKPTKAQRRILWALAAGDTLRITRLPGHMRCRLVWAKRSPDFRAVNTCIRNQWISRTGMEKGPPHVEIAAITTLGRMALNGVTEQ